MNLHWLCVSTTGFIGDDWSNIGIAVGVVVGIIALFLLILLFSFGQIWIQAKASGVPLSLFGLFGM